MAMFDDDSQLTMTDMSRRTKLSGVEPVKKHTCRTMDAHWYLRQLLRARILGVGIPRSDRTYAGDLLTGMSR